MYGSIFWRPTRYPRASSSAPMDAAARPLPSEDTTPPVTKMYFGAKSALPFVAQCHCSHIADLGLPVDEPSIQAAISERLQYIAYHRTAGDAERHDVLARERGPHRVALARVPLQTLAGRRLREM